MERYSGSINRGNNRMKNGVQVPFGFVNWVEILMKTEKKLMHIIPISNYHVDPSDEKSYNYAHKIMNLLSENNTHEAIQEYMDNPDNKKFSKMH